MTTTAETSETSAFIDDPAVAAKTVIAVGSRFASDGSVRPMTMVFPKANMEEAISWPLDVGFFMSSKGLDALIKQGIPTLVEHMRAPVVVFILIARPHSPAAAELLSAADAARAYANEWVTIVESISSTERIVYAGFTETDEGGGRHMVWIGPKRDTQEWSVPTAIQTALTCWKRTRRDDSAV